MTTLEHELRNPLATILSSVELVNALGVGAKEVPELLRVVDLKARAMATVLDNLFDDTYTTFTLEKETTSAQDVPVIDTVARTLESALRVLIVDDNESAADSLGQLLTLRGYSVEVAYNGTQALIKARIFKPQAAILDIGMPDMDGYELVRLLREEKFFCTYIALTGFGQSHDKKKAQLSGFDFHLTKPTGIKEIVKMLEKVASTKTD